MGFLEKVVALMAFLTLVLVLVTLNAFLRFSDGLTLVRMQPVIRVIFSQFHFGMALLTLVGDFGPLVTFEAFRHIRHILRSELIFFGYIPMTENAFRFPFQVFFMRENKISSGSNQRLGIFFVFMTDRAFVG